MRRPLLLLAASLALGAGLGSGVSTGRAWLLLALALSLLALALGAGRRAATGAVCAAAVAVGAAGAAAERAGFRRMPLLAWMAAGHAREDPVAVEGVAVHDVRQDAVGTVLLLDVREVTAAGRRWPLAGRARLEIGGEARLGVRPVEVREGDVVRVWARLRLPNGLGDRPDPSRAAQAARSGLHAVGYCKSSLLVERTGSAAGPVQRHVVAARHRARERIQRVVPPGREQAVVKAMVLGERAALDEETLEAFRSAGTYHVLALSGAQVALVAALVVWALRLAHMAPWAQAVVACVALAFYARLVGAEVPVTRAAFMAMVLVAGRSLDLDGDAANLLGLAAAALLSIRPSLIGDVSFQLSFVATLGLIVLTPALTRGVPRLPLRLDLAVGASVAALLVLAPLLVAHFHRLALAALLLNLAAAPLSAATLLCGAAAAVTPSAWPLAGLLGDLAWCSAHALLRSAEVALAFPALDLGVPDPPALAVLVYLAGLAVLAGGGAAGGAGGPRGGRGPGRPGHAAR